jgi:hypothetical protein
MLKIKLATQKDHETIWSIFKSVIKTGDTYVFEPNTTKENFKKYWLSDYMHTYIAFLEGEIVATYILIMLGLALILQTLLIWYL